MSTAKRQKRKVNDLVVPDIAEDAAERKRILNVLAQRRYSMALYLFSFKALERRFLYIPWKAAVLLIALCYRKEKARTRCCP